MNEPRRMISGDPAPAEPIPADVLDPAVRLADMRTKRVTDRLAVKLDRAVPVETLAVTNAKILTVDDERWSEMRGDVDDAYALEEIEGFAGDVHRLRTKCQDCLVEIFLDSVDYPGQWARMVELGVLRGVRGTIRCEECLSKIARAEAATETEAKKRERLNRSDLPAPMHRFYFNEMLPEGGRKYVVEQVREWSAIKRPANGLYVHGGNGRGKTRLAATAAWARLAQWDVRWVSMPVLLAQLGAAFSDDARRAAIQVLTGRGALILDDLDKTTPSEWAANQIFAALDTRLQAGAPLLITANLAPERLGEKFKGEVGEAIRSRVAGLDVYELPGRDNRVELPGLTKMTEEDAARHGLVDPEVEE